MQTDVCWHALVSSDVYWCVLNRTHVSPLAFYDKKTVHLSTINNTRPGMMREERQGKHRNPQSRSTPARWWWTASAARVTSDVNIRNSMMMDGLGAWAGVTCVMADDPPVTQLSNLLLWSAPASCCVATNELWCGLLSHAPFKCEKSCLQNSSQSWYAIFDPVIMTLWSWHVCRQCRYVYVLTPYWASTPRVHCNQGSTRFKNEWNCTWWQASSKGKNCSKKQYKDQRVSNSNLMRSNCDDIHSSFLRPRAYLLSKTPWLCASSLTFS